MGLLKEALLLADKKPVLQKGGLLAKIERSALNSSDFHTWAKLNHFCHAAVFQCISSNYVITDAWGIDAETITTSVSTFDFFNGTLLSNDGWLSAASGTKSIEPFYQLFSQDFKEKLRDVSFLKLSPDEKAPVLMLLSFENEQLELPASDDKLKEKVLSFISNENELIITETQIRELSETPATLFILSLKLALENIVDNAITIPETARIASDTIYKEILWFLQDSFAVHHLCCKGLSNEIKIAFYSKNSVDISFFQMFISNALSSILNQESAGKILLLSAGNTDNTSAIHNFLLKG